MPTSETNLCSGLPQLGVATALHGRLRHSLRSSLVELIRSGQRSLRVDLTHLADRAEALDVSRPFASDLFTAHWLLVEAIQTKDVRGLVDALEATEQVLGSPYSTEGEVRVCTLDSSLADAGVLKFVLGPEGARGMDGEVPVMQALTHTQLTAVTPVIRGAISMIGECEPAIGEELGEYVSEIRPFQGRVVRGTTSMRAFGTIYLRLPDKPYTFDDELLYYVDHLTHETSHLHLHAIMNIDPLILNDWTVPSLS